MKLEQINIDATSALQPVQLNEISNALTFVYGEKSTGKSAVGRFFRNLLFGQQSELTNGHVNSLSAPLIGRSRVNLVGQRFDLHRRSGHANELAVQAIDGYQPTAPITQADLTANVSPSIYDAIFNFSFRNTRNNARHLAAVLHRELGVDCGIQASGDDSALRGHQQTLEALQAQLIVIEAKMASLKSERAEILRLETSQVDFQRQLASLDGLIASTQARISELGSSPTIDQLSRIDSEIRALRLRIDNASTEVIYPVVEKPVEDASLYNQLDELENQIRRWRNVQTDVQNQRVRLRDEMLVWNELTLESNEHPYYNAREILVALETKVDQAERSANHWAGIDDSSRVDTGQLADSLGELCQHMRDDLYRLCNELSHQYKHLRHKAAATELKQLRRCYTEMGENIERLVQRRASLIKEIQVNDPAGADLIVRADLKFCQCAQHEGYLEARKRFVGPVSTGTPKPVRIEPDLSHEQNRLASLEAERAEVLGSQGRFDAELNELNRQLASQLQQRDDLVSKLIAFDQTRVSNIDAELLRLDDQYRTIKSQQSNRPRVTATDPILVRATNWLPRLTTGKFVRVFLTQTSHHDSLQLQVQNSAGQSVAFDALPPGTQDQVYLSLVLSAKEELQGTRGVELPTMIDDVFAHIENEQINPTVDLLTEVVRQGHQVILFSQHRYLSDRFPEVRLLEIKRSHEIRTPTPLPQPPVQHTPRYETRTAQNDSASYRVKNLNAGELEQLRVQVSQAQVNQNQAPPYPLSKYRRNDEVLLGQGPRIYSEPPLPPANVNSDDSYNAHRTSYRTPTSSQFAALPVDSFTQPIHLHPAIAENTPLDQMRLFSADNLQFFNDHRIFNVGDLFKITEDYAEGIGLALETIAAWQAELWLLSTVPGMKDVEARLLVAAGVSEPGELVGLSAQALVERIQRYSRMNSSRSGEVAQAIDFDRVSVLQRNANQSRDHWEHRQRPYFVTRSVRPRDDRESNGSSRPRRSERGERDYRSRSSRDGQRRDYRPTDAHSDANRESRNGRINRTDRAERTPRPSQSFSERNAERNAQRVSRGLRSSKNDREVRIAPSLAPVSNRSNRDTNGSVDDHNSRTRPESVDGRVESPKRSEEKTSDKKLKFYLNLGDQLEAAPSIGAKTAERFEAIGVETVDQFLKQTAESMATKLNYKRITAKVIRDWQHQARFVCRVPNLRGHDAQLLVGCDITEPETLATMQPQSLLNVILPFAESKEGIRIIRNGKKPDLAEINDWIAWAAEMRSIQAA